MAGARIAALLYAACAALAGCGSKALPAVESGTPSLPAEEGGVPLPDASTPADSSPADASSALIVALSAASIDFGLVNCATGSATRTLTVTNTSPDPQASVKYAASVSPSSIFSLAGGAAGLVFPGASGTIGLAASGIPASTAAGTVLTGELTVTTDVPGAASVVVPLEATAAGATLTTSPTLAAFGQVQLANPGAPVPLSITNTGNVPVEIELGVPQEPDGGAESEFGVALAGAPFTLAPGASLADAGVTFSPTTPGTKTATSALTTLGAMCGSSPTSFAMSGTGTTAQITVGPSPLVFGSVSCGTTGAVLTVTLTNTSPDAVTYTSVLGKGSSSPYTLDAGSGTLPGDDGDAGVVVLTLTPRPIPATASLAPGAFDDALLVTPMTPFVSATTIQLDESAQGASLGVLMPTTSFGTVSTSKSLGFTVTNSGNLDAPLTLTTTGAGYSATITSGAAVATANNGVAIGQVTFTPTASGSAGGTLLVSTTAALCALAPRIIDLSAVGDVEDAGTD